MLMSASIDSSDFMRNGDYTPTRLEAQHDAVNLICNAKTQSNPESTVGVVACGGKSPAVMVTLTNDIGKVLTSLHSLKIGGALSLVSGIQVAQLVLKHRQNKSQQQRIVFFVGSPIEEEKDNLVKLGKRLKKNNIAVDIINFGEETENADKLEAFMSAVTSDSNSHLVTVPPGPHVLSDILISSPIVNEGAAAGGAPGRTAEDFGMYGGVDPNLDPELALALKMSMDEERARQEATRGETAGPAATAATPSATPQDSAPKEDDMMIEAEDEEMAKAFAMSLQTSNASAGTTTTTTTTTTSSQQEDVPMDEYDENDELKLALALSMGGAPNQEDDLNNAMADPNFVNSVLATLPGVDPNDEGIKKMLEEMAKQQKKD